MMNARKLAVVVVDDVPDVLKGIRSAIGGRYQQLVDVFTAQNWPDFRKQSSVWLPSAADLVVCDVNLMGDLPEETVIDGVKITEFDGLRVYGYVAKTAPHIPCILFTARDLAKDALDQFDSPSLPLWVVKKANIREDLGVVEAAVTKLKTVALSLLWAVPVTVRRAACDLMCGGCEVLPPATVVVSPALQKVAFEWKSLLCVLDGGGERWACPKPALLAETLARFTRHAHKSLMLTRLCKPGGYCWPGDKFGIADPQAWIEVKLGTWGATETILHANDTLLVCPASTAPKWIKAQDAAESEYESVRPLLLESTDASFSDVWRAARQFGQQMKAGTTDDRKTALQATMTAQTNLKDKVLYDCATWRTVLNQLCWGTSSCCGDLLDAKHYAEWCEIRQGLTYLVASVGEATSGGSGPPICDSTIRKNDPCGIWTLRLTLADSGPGIDDLRSCFLLESDNRPTLYPAKGHKLQRAQALLWGYCRWAVYTKGQSDASVRVWDVYGENNSADWDDSGVRASLNNEGSGTLHVLEFDNPLPA